MMFDAGVKVSDEEIEGDGEEDVDISLFPTVDSGRLTACIALVGSNMSAGTTSRYAHAGTAVAKLIFLGYLSSAVKSRLRIGERNNGGRTWILRPLKWCNLCAMRTT